MKKLFWILASVVFIGSLIILTIALTNNSPENPFREYRLLVGLTFLVLNRFTIIIYRKLYGKKLTR
jgi:hypothetical protein